MHIHASIYVCLVANHSKAHVCQQTLQFAIAMSNVDMGHVAFVCQNVLQKMTAMPSCDRRSWDCYSRWEGALQSVLSEKLSCNITRVDFPGCKGMPQVHLILGVWPGAPHELIAERQNSKWKLAVSSGPDKHEESDLGAQHGHHGVHGVPVGPPRTNSFCALSAELTLFGIIADVQDDQLGHPMLSMETKWGWDFEVELLDGRTGLPMVLKHCFFHSLQKRE